MSKGLSEFMYSQLDELKELFQKKHEQYSSGADASLFGADQYCAAGEG